jgi:transcriptional accessory protein Tex/SPT6
MSDAQERLSREECAKWCDKVFNALNAYPKHWTKPHLAKPNAKQAAAYLRADADLAARLETAEAACAIMRERAERCEAAEAERDALAEQVASCRTALEWLREIGLFWFVDEHGLLDVARGKVQPKDEWMTDLSNATGVPVEHLTGDPK